MKTFEYVDYLVFVGYFVVVIALAWYVSRRPGGHERNTEDYFLAGRNLPWWIIGASLIASNISTEQLIGMNGTAFESGIAVISYSLVGAALPLLLVARFFLPAFLKMKIYSMPEFLRKRYDSRVSTAMGVFWILVYVFVNLTSVLSLGAITLEAVLGIPVLYSVVALALISAAYTIYGGLTAVAWTDFIQVGILLLGGASVVVIGLDRVAGGEGALQGFITLLEVQPQSFHTILPADHPELPWTGIFLGGLWIAALSYWGCNQYIIQRALAAKNLNEAKHGLLFAAFLSLLVAIIIVVPGVIASNLFQEDITARDQAFPFLIKELLPPGYVGVVIASLIAAIISSLNSMCNSVATIFTLDIYQKTVGQTASHKTLITVGRLTTAIALLLAVLITPSIAKMGRLFAFIQEYTGFVTPGVLCIFLLGLFWKKANAHGALAAIILTIPLSMAFKIMTPDIAFLNRMMLTFLILIGVQLSFGWLAKKRTTAIDLEINVFASRSSPIFYIGSLVVIGLVASIYLVFT